MELTMLNSIEHAHVVRMHIWWLTCVLKALEQSSPLRLTWVLKALETRSLAKTQALETRSLALRL